MAEDTQANKAMPERDRSKVTLVLSEEDARWLLQMMTSTYLGDTSARIYHEIKHALAECECGEEGR